MSQFSKQIVKSFVANSSIPAYVCVTRAATTTLAVSPWNTVTAFILGVSANAASTGDSVQVVIAGSAKVICQASVSAGALCGPGTVTANITGGGPGAILERTGSFTSTIAYRHLGIALEAGSTNSVIEVLIHVGNISGV